MTAALKEQRTTTTGGSRHGADAKEGKGVEDASGEKKKPFFKSKKFIIIMVLVLGVGGGVYKFMFAPKPKVVPEAGVVVPINDMLMNLSGGHYLKLSLGIQLLKSAGAGTDFYTADAAAAAINEFSGRSAASLLSMTTRDELMKELTAKIKKAYPDKVFNVLPTQFVTQ
jgi:flagellar FliL protein